MSELMTQAIIGMPFDMAMSDELSRRQFYSRAQSLLQDFDAMRQRAEKAEELLMLLRGMIGCTKENDALQMGTWISTHHPVIERIDAALAKKAE